MKELGAAFREHFDRPRRVGRLEDATGRSRVENPACGDVLEVTLRVESGKIAALRWKCHGCSSSVASASVIGDLAEGHTLADARAIDAAAVESALGGLPSTRRHGAELAVDALRAALEDHERSPRR